VEHFSIRRVTAVNLPIQSPCSDSQFSHCLQVVCSVTLSWHPAGLHVCLPVLLYVTKMSQCNISWQAQSTGLYFRINHIVSVQWHLSPLPLTSNDPWPRFQGYGVTIDAFHVLCAQLTRDLFAIANFLVFMFMIMQENWRKSTANVVLKDASHLHRTRPVGTAVPYRYGTLYILL